MEPISEWINLLVILSIASISLWLIARSLSRRLSMPPGPFGAPLVGYLPWIDRANSHRTYQALAQRYGDLFRFRLGSRTVIGLASYELIREAFFQPLFSGRLPSRFVRQMTRGCGILFTEGESWSHQRSFSLRFLKSVGFARAESARQISQELANMISRLDRLAESGEPVVTIELLTPAVNSVIARLTLGQAYADEDPNYRAYIQAFDEYARLMNPLPMLFPFIDKIFHWTRTAKEIQRRFDVMFNFVDGEVKKRRLRASTTRGTDGVDSPTCLADAYNAAKAEAESAGDFETYSDFQIVRVCMELFFGGTATTARSLEWMLLYMAAYPEEQTKVQDELDQLKSGRSREDMISLEDRTNLNYTQAVIDECYRRVSLSSNGTFHRATEDVKFHGYLIPKDAAIMPLAYAVHHSPKYWSRPNSFYPGHFLDSQGRYQPSRYLIPFMIGRRACLGEGLARQEIFLIFANLMRRYRLELLGFQHRLQPEERDKLLEGKLSLIRIPDKHALLFSRR